MPRRLNIVGTGDFVFLQDNRQPEYKVLLFDGAVDSMTDIVANRATQVPLDITDEVEEVSVNEDLGNAGSCTFSFVPDREGAKLTPMHFLGKKYIRVLYGDRRLTATGDDLFEIFTGVIAGQPGYINNRDSITRKIRVQAYDRQWNWNRRGKKINSPAFLQGADFGDVAVEAATNTKWGMGLDRVEVAFGKQGIVNQHSKIQLRDETAIELLNNLMFPSNKIVQFDGSGSLVTRDFDFNKGPTRVWDQFDGVIKDYSWPQELIDVINVVRVLGLDHNLSEILHPQQPIIDLDGTIGFFQSVFEDRYYFTDDHRGRARNLSISKKTINGFLGSIGNSFELIQKDDFSFVLKIETPYQAWLFITFFVIYIALVIAGEFLPALATAAAIWLTLGLALMQQIGTFQVQVSGTFFEQVYAQLSGEARWSHTSLEETRRSEIRNDLISTQAQVDAIAKRELVKETVKGASRNMVVLEDTALEVADIVETKDGSRFFIRSISRKLQRGENVPMMNMTVWKIRDGNEFNGVAGVGEFP